MGGRSPSKTSQNVMKLHFFHRCEQFGVIFLFLSCFMIKFYDFCDFFQKSISISISIYRYIDIDFDISIYRYRYFDISIPGRGEWLWAFFKILSILTKFAKFDLFFFWKFRNFGKFAKLSLYFNRYFLDIWSKILSKLSISISISIYRYRYRFFRRYRYRYRYLLQNIEIYRSQNLDNRYR